MAATKLWTVGDVAKLPDDNYRYALIKGVVLRRPPRTLQQGHIVNVFGARS